MTIFLSYFINKNGYTSLFLNSAVHSRQDIKFHTHINRVIVLYISILNTEYNKKPEDTYCWLALSEGLLLRLVYAPSSCGNKKIHNLYFKNIAVISKTPPDRQNQESVTDFGLDSIRHKSQIASV